MAGFKPGDVGHLAEHDRIKGELAGRLSDTSLSAEFAPRSFVQTAENIMNEVWHLTPPTPGYAPFQVQAHSWPGTGAAAGTSNHSMHFGWNAARHSGGVATEGKPAIYMGFEDDYYDYAGDLTHGVEWYVGYVSPDGTTNAVADLRPFYFRILDSDKNIVDKSVFAHVDIGSGPLGYFAVMGSVKNQTALFDIHHTGIFAHLPFTVTTPSGPAVMRIQSPNGPTNPDKQTTLQFYLGSTAQWQITSDNFNEIYFQDMVNSRVHLNLIRGANPDTAVVDVEATLKLGNTTATTAAAGASGALPAQVAGYFQVQDKNGVLRKVPYYA